MMKILHDIPLKTYNTFSIDTMADSFAQILSVDDLLDLFNSQELNRRKFLILGGGSNVLFRTDYDGLVIKIDLKGIEKIAEDDHHIYVKAMAGEDWDGLVSWCVELGWGGLENLSGIPGSVGAGPIQNIGAYGAELKDHFYELEAMDIKSGTVRAFNLEDCGFGYRDSIFKRELKGKYIILSVTLQLEKVPQLNLSYRGLRERIEKNRTVGREDDKTLGGKDGKRVGGGEGETKGVGIGKIRETVLEIRREKLPDPAVLGNAGSFFKNPVVSSSELEKLKERFPGIVYYEVKVHPPAGGSKFTDKQPDLSVNGHWPTASGPRPPTTVKLAAGWLIEHCGWKGFREGDAGIHKDQALVLVNYGNATGQEILDLARRIQVSVLENFGVELEMEVNVVN